MRQPQQDRPSVLGVAFLSDSFHYLGPSDFAQGQSVSLCVDILVPLIF